MIDVSESIDPLWKDWAIFTASAWNDLSLVAQKSYITTIKVLLKAGLLTVETSSPKCTQNSFF